MHRLFLRILLLWLLFILPLAVLTPGNDYVIQPKWTIMMLGGVLVGAAWAVSGWKHVRRHPLFVPIALLLGGAVLSGMSAMNLPQAGRVALQRVALAAACLTAATGALSLGRALWISAFSIAIQAWVAWEQSRGHWIVGHGEQFGAGRIYATLGNPSFYGVYLAPVAAWFLYAFLDAWMDRRWPRLAGSGAVLGVILLLMNRAAVVDAWAGLGLGAAVMAWLVVSRGRMPRPGRG